MLYEYLNDYRKEFSGYNYVKLKQDLLAGLTVTAVALPLALAFGVGCGATASAGLITAIIAGLVIGILSGASYQISGPTGAMTAVLLVLFQRYGLEGVWAAGLVSGIIMVTAGVMKLGKIVAYIPAPVITGFTSGIALIIAIGQLDSFFGFTNGKAESTAVKLYGYFSLGIAPDWNTVLLGCIVIITMLSWPGKWNSVLPSSLAGLIAALVTNLIFNFPVPLIGEIPKTLLPSSHLDIFSLNPAKLQGILVPAVSIAALGMIESLLCGEVGGRMKEEKFNTNRELIAQGIGNIVIPFFGGVPATAAIARTSVGIRSGGQTRLVSVFHSVGLLLSMLFLAPVMSKIPLSALAGVLIVTAWRMNEWKNIKFIFSRKFKGAISKFLITMIATVVFDLTQAIIIGVVFAAVVFIVGISRMDINIENVDEEKFAQKSGILVKKPLGHVRVVYFSGPIFFATVERLISQLSQLNDTSIIILSMRGVPLIDTSGLQALENLNQNLKKKNCTLMFCGLQPRVADMLKRSSLFIEMGENKVFWSADQAITAAYEMAVI